MFALYSTHADVQYIYRTSYGLYIFLKHKCPFYDLSDAEHMGAEAGLLQHRAEDYHKE